MRRAVSAVVVTIAVSVLLFTFKPQTQLTISSEATRRAVAASTTRTTPAATTRTSSPRTTSSSSPAAPRPAAAAVRTVVGPAVDTRYGTVQVAVTLSGTRLTNVRALALPNGDSQTDEINAQAGPLLAQEALAAQTGNVDTISGASYTSDGYRQSLQAALDRAAGA